MYSYSSFLMYSDSAVKKLKGFGFVEISTLANKCHRLYDLGNYLPPISLIVSTLTSKIIREMLRSPWNHLKIHPLSTQVLLLRMAISFRTWCDGLSIFKFGPNKFNRKTTISILFLFYCHLTLQNCFETDLNTRISIVYRLQYIYLRPALPEKQTMLEIIWNDLCSYSVPDIPTVKWLIRCLSGQLSRIFIFRVVRGFCFYQKFALKFDISSFVLNNPTNTHRYTLAE